MTVAGEGQVPVGKLLGQPAPKPSRWRAAMRWRDWSLPVKLGAITLVPIIVALALGGVTLGSQLGESSRYERVNALVELDTSAAALLDGVQRERALTADALTQGTGAASAELREARAAVDAAAGPVNAAAAPAVELEPGIAGQRQDVADQLARLAELRERVGAGQVGPVEAVGEYTALTTALLNLDTALVSGMGDTEIGATPSALHNLLVAKEEVSLQQALIGYGIGRSGLAPSEFNQVRTSDVRLTDRLSEFGSAATDGQRRDFDSTVRGEAFDERDRIVKGVLAAQDTGSGEAFRTESAQQWRDLSGSVFTSMGEVGQRLGGQLTATASDLAGGASTAVVVLAVLFVVALLLAAAVVFLITRQLLRSLKVLRTTALDVAEHGLPEAVRTIQEGRSQSAEISPTPVHTDDEIGQVARAFDAVHAEALRLAAEQAGMRTGYASVFVNLSRRSQSLVQRQLQLIERLERDEEDADQLATLFQLDHLATRMRRNNENLMVLSGAEPGRRSGQPVSVTDVLRAAVSEIEQYQRVVVQTPPSVRIVGYAAGDLVRLAAELLDNATAFSAPETQVTVATRLMDDGSLTVDIMDKGIGMNEAEVAEANARLTEAGSIDLATSRRMGLFVVGRLAGRHNFGVVLHGGKDIVGVRATVSVPAELVMGAQQQQQQQPSGATAQLQAPVSTAATAVTGVPGTAQETPAQPSAPHPATPLPPKTPGGLPRRKPNGTRRPGVLQELAGGAAQQSPSDTEVSGTALFTPIGKDEQEQPNDTPPAWPDAADAARQKAESESAAEVTAAFDKPSLEAPAPTQNPQEAQDARDTEAGQESAGALAQSTPTERIDSTVDSGKADAGNADPQPGEQPEQTAPPSTKVTAKSGSPTAAAKAAEVDPLSGEALFEATGTVVSDWWSAATTASDAERRAQRAQSVSETTPIFDEMLSAWFRSVSESPSETSGGAKKEWDFAADERWRTVQAVSRTAPSDYTQAGLPRRRKGEQLLPGSAAAGQARASAAQAAQAVSPPQQQPSRDPADVRGRLSSFQQGVSRGRRHRQAETAARQGQSAATERPTTSAGLPQRQPRKPATRGKTAAPQGEVPPQAVSGSGSGQAPASEWAFAADERWSAVQAASQAGPSNYTAAGLPRRRKGAQLLPGSLSAASGQASRPKAERDPADVRGRLSSFQQGIRRGRHRTAQASESSQEKVEGE
ncbi:nitrate- and nitrite sensing domain-containing protein [Saccharomonospora sp. NPDC006951]